ncbi:alpha/beta-hydrolase [Aspergillus indologenus CBS 114.80]|uniref:Carboxylic ester hydrolase n=1 Tax=Aspergillus indologenus CBS 114.80 TaxID=1450541 RepID=A0A2V5IDW5_9EURO|nr:alpha/beta-hydrolase [Aspergillus indologenus CBS 114.80]
MPAVINYPHPSLGTVRGLASASTHQFRGIPYASLVNGWAAPVVVEGDPSGSIDATSLGPTAPSPPMGVEMEFSHIQQRLPTPSVHQSATECLNLNLTAPGNHTCGSRLPVMVFLHGGGYAIGANSWPQYDFQRLVELSVRMGHPVIGINVNYRLGALGFLTSEELVARGYPPNRGLLDQRAALLWIQKYIAGFGGDPQSLTLVGQSAGGVSATHHLQSELPLFKRMVSMGGTNLLMRPLPHAVAESTYRGYVDRLGLGSLSAAERVQALLTMDYETIVAAFSPADALLPVSGGELRLTDHTYAEIYQGDAGSLVLPGRKWCERIMIGDCQSDGSIMSTMLSYDPVTIASSFRASFERSLGSADKVDLIMKEYGISEESAGEEAYDRILTFVTDLCFFLPILQYGHYWSGQAHLYNFNEPNPWDGRWKGRANHILDVAFLFQNYNDLLSEPQRAVAIQFAEDLIAFAHGREPWKPFRWETTDLHTRVYGGRAAETVGQVQTLLAPDPRTERSTSILNLTATVPADELSRAFGVFLSGH